MNRIEKEIKNFYEDLTKQEHKCLRKEFYENIEIRFKIFLWSGIVLLLPAIVSGGFVLYYLLNIYFAVTDIFQLQLCAIIFTVNCIASFFLTSYYHRKFRTWLRESKNIVTKSK